MKKLFAALCKTIAEYRVDFAECIGLRECDRFTKYARRPGLGLRTPERRTEIMMKKLIVNVVAYFAEYGDLINKWNSVL